MPPRACIQAVSPGRYRVGNWVASELDRVAEPAGYLSRDSVPRGGGHHRAGAGVDVEDPGVAGVTCRHIAMLYRDSSEDSAAVDGFLEAAIAEQEPVFVAVAQAQLHL